jgi:Tol biopolymer transport system component
MVAALTQVPSALPDATSPIVFLRGILRIWSTAPEGTHQRQLTAKIANFPTWSPDHRWIAYTADRLDGRSCAAASQEIWLMRPNGSGKRQLTHLCPAQAIGLSWSPDGSQIAFGRSVSPPGGIWVSNIDGSGSTAITNDQGGWKPGLVAGRKAHPLH